jgi:hypothetical protein
MKTSLALGLVASLSIACAPPWTIVRQTTPDPFVGHPQFTIEPLHFEQAQVGGKSEAAYAAEKEASKQASWEEDKNGMNERFSAAIASTGVGLQLSGPGGAGAIVRPIVTFMEPGFYVGVASHPTELKMRIQILDPQGQPLDEIAVHSSVGASMTDPASGSRFREAAEHLGRVTAKYLQTRVTPDK